MHKSGLILGLLLSVLALCTSALHAESYMSEKEFLKEIFITANNDQIPQAETLWMTPQLQTQISSILDHPYPKLRIRYWTDQQSTVWFLEEIGKERPISFGISVKNQLISKIKVLEFRESRGGEIKMQAFSDQFNQIGSTKDSQLDRHIDGITGATMSVTAMKKIAVLAILLTKHIAA